MSMEISPSFQIPGIVKFALVNQLHLWYDLHRENLSFLMFGGTYIILLSERERWVFPLFHGFLQCFLRL